MRCDFTLPTMESYQDMYLEISTYLVMLASFPTQTIFLTNRTNPYFLRSSHHRTLRIGLLPLDVSRWLCTARLLSMHSGKRYDFSSNCNLGWCNFSLNLSASINQIKHIQKKNHLNSLTYITTLSTSIQTTHPKRDHNSSISA
jgi:hypothetical protein